MALREPEASAYLFEVQVVWVSRLRSVGGVPGQPSLPSDLEERSSPKDPQRGRVCTTLGAQLCSSGPSQGSQVTWTLTGHWPLGRTKY